MHDGLWLKLWEMGVGLWLKLWEMGVGGKV